MIKKIMKAWLVVDCLYLVIIEFIPALQSSQTSPHFQLFSAIILFIPLTYFLCKKINDKISHNFKTLLIIVIIFLWVTLIVSYILEIINQ